MEKKQETPTPKVFTAISNVMAELASSGISKDRKNEQQGYKFRGIDDVYNALAPLLSKHGLVILPRCIGREVVERQTQRGGVLFYVTVDVEFAFVAAEDGSSWIVRMPGEAMDSADKATNKAMSAAYKYACLQAFCIPTEGDNDADATTHQVVAKKPQPIKTLGDTEIETIKNLAEKVGVDVSRICSAYAVESLSEIPMSEVSSIVSKLQQKVEAK